MLCDVSSCFVVLCSDPYSFVVLRSDLRCSGCILLLRQCSVCDPLLRYSGSAGQCFTRYQVNDSLREQCVLNGFGFICNDNISRTHLWKNGIHLEDLGTNIPAGNFVDFLNRFTLSKSSEYL